MSRDGGCGRVGSRRAPPSGASGPTATLPAPRASRAPSLLAAHHRGRDGEAEREGASVASGCGGEGAGPEVPEGGSERGGGGGWGAEGRSEPFQGSHIIDPRSRHTTAARVASVARRSVLAENHSAASRSAGATRNSAPAANATRGANPTPRPSATTRAALPACRRNPARANGHCPPCPTRLSSHHSSMGTGR